MPRIVVLTSNPYMIELTRRKLPDPSILTVVYDDARCHVDDAIPVSSLRLFDKLTDASKAARELVEGYSLYAKLLIPLAWPDEDLLYLDDDVLITRSPEYLLELEKPFFSANVLDRLSELNIQDVDLIEHLGAAFDVDWSVWRNNMNCVDCGVSYYTAKTRPQWRQDLHTFIHHEGIQDYFTRHRGKNRGRMLDQRFLTMHVSQLVHKRLTSRQDYMVIPYRFPSPYLKRPLRRWPTFIHYGASSHKPGWAGWLDEHVTYDVLH